MKRKRVDSSCIKSVGYSETRRILEIEFIQGTVYQYYAVPLDVYLELMEAESKGRYFGSEIRDCYEYTRLPY